MSPRRFGVAERLAAAVVARHELVRAVKILNGIGVIPMPLKGVLLQHTVYRDPAERAIADADLLVPPGRARQSVDALRDHGYSQGAFSGAAVSSRSPGSKLALDLHVRLFPPGLFALRAADLFTRGRLDERLFDAVVVLPDPLDVYAHLVGNFAKGRNDAHNEAQLRDFGALASRYALAPRGIARHLERHGLARAARYTLPLAVDAGDGHADQVLHALRADRLGAASARVARALSERYGSTSPASFLAPHLVNRSLPRGAVSAASRMALGLKNRAMARLGGRALGPPPPPPDPDR